jgi:hypothetical protein
MTPTLDRSRDYGTVHGDHEYGAHTVQDGFFYDAQDNLIEGAMDEVQVRRLAELREQTDAVAEAKATFRKLMPNMSEADVDKLINVENLKPANPNDEEIDLAKWGAGLQPKVLYSRVAQKIRQEFNQSPANKRQALEILAEHGVIPPIGGTSTIPSQT